MAELILLAGAAYLGVKAARKVTTAYRQTREQMYAQQEFSDYYDQPQNSYAYDYHQHPGRSTGGYSHSTGHSYGYH
jgi:hypothetical protein